MDFTAVYAEHLQKYTVTFNSNSDIIPVNPTSVVAEWGTTIFKPTILEEDIPEGVRFLGWFDSTGNP